MKRHLNTSYRLVWNHITGTLVVASELARSRGKRAGVAVAMSLAAVTSVPALAADTVVQAGETVNGGTLTNHDNQIVFGTANGMTISTGLELGPDSEENTGGQWIQNGGIAGNTTVTTNGRQVVLEGGTASDTVIRDGGGQSLNGLAVNTTLNNRGEQWVHEGGVATGTIINRDGYQSVKSGGLATGTIINTGAEGGPDSDNSYTGQKVQGTAESTTINKNGRQIILFSGIARDTLIYAGGDQSVHGRALNTTLNGGYQYVHKDGLALNTVINEGGWQVVKAGGAVGNTTINQNGELRVHAGGEATAVTQNTGGALVTSTAATVTGTNRLGNFFVGNGMADNVVLENGGSFTVNAGGQAGNTTVGYRGTLTLAAGGSLSGRTQLSKGASMVLNGDVVSTGDIVNAGEIRFDNQTTPDAALSRAVAKGASPVTFHKLTTSNLTGQGGTINMRVRLDGSNASDQLVINGGQATGKTWLAFTNVGNSNLGVATSGQGIRVVDAQNGATTEEGAFALSRPLQAGAFNYTLNRDSDEDWYLRSENAYRAEVPLYASMLTQAMDYDRILAGSRSHQTGVSGENNSVRLSIQGGHLGHDNNGGIARGATPESSGSYGFVRLEGDLLRTEVAGMSLTTGVYGAAGHSSVDVKDDDGSRAGTVRDDAGSLGGYLNLVHTSSGLWADIVAQGTRHSMKASSDNNDFRARGWGWLGSLETGLPFSITDNLMLEPQLQYTWQGLSLDDGQDNAGYVKFGHGSAQHVRAGFRLGSHNDMNFGKGTSSRDTLRDSAKHSVSELPVNWWVQPSVIRTFSSRGDMSMSTAAAGSNMTFSPSRNGTSLDLQAGLEARVRENITLGVQAGYAHSVSGSSAEGYNGQATLNVTF
ncbi:Ag43/Cah family autotransporter adhesin [Escherichia coli]|uniref:Ag43/Cah family autotransporter adhesin n=1 Tax=Escherichia coli TaxID=562 RepID=UPI0002A312EE|nr:Ag43/Cah family autotransporter adhesin [Escherichia coli]ELE57669.1 phage antigen 43 (Ag43) phase-variable biofilm formation autotransporter [Escherichia coli KTE76]